MLTSNKDGEAPLSDIFALKQELRGIISDLSTTGDPMLVKRLSEEADKFDWGTSSHSTHFHTNNYNDPEKISNRNTAAAVTVASTPSSNPNKETLNTKHFAKVEKQGLVHRFESSPPTVHINRHGSIDIITQSPSVKAGLVALESSRDIHATLKRVHENKQTKLSTPLVKPIENSSQQPMTLIAATDVTSALAAVEPLPPMRAYQSVSQALPLNYNTDPQRNHFALGSNETREANHVIQNVKSYNNDKIFEHHKKSSDIKKELAKERGKNLKLKDSIAGMEMKHTAKINDLEYRLGRAVKVNQSVHKTEHALHEAFDRLSQDKRNLEVQVRSMRTQLHEQNQVLLKRQQHVGHLRRTIDDDQDKNGTVHLELLRLKQDAIKHERESADDAARILALREDIQAQSRQLEKLRDTLATQRLQEVDYANEVEEAKSQARLMANRLQSASSERDTAIRDAEETRALSLELTSQLQQRDAKVKQLQEQLTVSCLAQEQATTDVDQKERERAHSEHSLRLRIRRLEADLDTEQDAARRARAEAERAGLIMKKHLSVSSAGAVSHIQQEQDLVHRLQDLETAAIGQLKETEKLQAERQESAKQADELNKENEILKESLHALENETSEFQTMIRKYEESLVQKDKLIAQMREEVMRMEAERERNAEREAQSEIQLEQQKRSVQLHDNERMKLRDRLQELELQNVALKGQQRKQFEMDQQQIVSSSSLDHASTAQQQGEAAGYEDRYRAAEKARIEATEKNVAFKAELVEIELTLDDLKQKLRSERKCTADQQTKLQEFNIQLADVDTAARVQAAKLLGTVVEKDNLIHQVSTALQQSTQREMVLEQELSRTRKDAEDLAKYYDKKSAQADALMHQVESTTGDTVHSVNLSPHMTGSGEIIQKLLSFRSRIEGLQVTEKQLRIRLGHLERALKKVA